MPTRTSSSAASPSTPSAALHTDTLSIEGGLFTAEWLGKVAAQQAPVQADADYAVRAGFNVREEIGLAWRSAQSLWRQFDQARHSPGHDAWGITQRWATELLRQCFAFQLTQHATPMVVAERHYPVPFSALGARVPVVVSPHDEPKPLDSAHDRLGDNSGERVRRRSAFGLLQESLNALPDALWGVATNGLQLRIARDNASLTRPAWVEVDLERLFSEERYADFSVLWLLLHGTRFGAEGGATSDCALEQWRSACREQGTRARETLRVGVEQALLVLGQGFAGHPANTALRDALASGRLSPQDYLHELLRLVYRQIFLLTVEERDILHRSSASPAAVALYAEGYSLRRLRERAVRRSAHDRHGDLWQSLKQVWLGLAVGEPLLALPPLGGLFDTTQCPTLDACRLENRHLMLALFHLAWLRANAHAPLTRVNWRDMGPEELGSIYESLLELVPQLSHGHRQFSFQTGAATRGNARKTTGSYYTADPLVQEQLDSTLEPVIQAILAAHPSGDGAVQALLAISVIDPACGSGHFLLAAARRIAGHLARVRAQMRDTLLGHGGQPTPDDYRHALRDVVGHCVYGVDMNPMALELARMALWLEAYTPDAPLGFIDHHLQLGNALIGVMDVKTLLQGIPDDAYAALTGDDKERCKALKRDNRAERARLEKLLKSPQGLDLETGIAEVAQPLIDIESLPDDTLAAIEIKRTRYRAIGSGGLGEIAQRQRLKTACDLYMGAFMVGKTAQQVVPTTQHVVNALLGQPVAPGLLMTASIVANSVPLLHWPIVFAQVFARGGFTIVLGNPPWERLKLQEEEYFAARAPAVAQARNKAERERAIQALAGHALGTPERAVYDGFISAKRQAEAASVFCHGPRYPLTGTGDVNSYALFAETSLQILHRDGRAGLVLPSGIATDDSTKSFFAFLINTKRLVSLLSFWEIRRIFPDTDSRDPFCLFTIGFRERAIFLFQAHRVEDLHDPRRRFELSPDDIARINPNTRTCPIFRSQHDADITTRIFQRIPVLWDENLADGNPWAIQFMRMLDMANDSGLFRDGRRRDELDHPVPLYEAKMAHQYDHRWATYVGEGDESRDLTDGEKADPARTVQPRYWVAADEIRSVLARRGWTRQWLVGWRDVTRSTDMRTLIAAVIPVAAVGDKFLLIHTPRPASAATGLYGNLNALVCDYVTRQKLGGTALKYFVIRQVPVLPPSTYTPERLDAIVPRVLELTYTANDLQPFYADVVAENPSWDPRTGAERGQPWRWNPERRAVLRAELDAIYARLYGLTRDELRYILDPADVMGADYPSETFRVLKDKETRLYGEYRTRRLVLEAWDRQAGSPA
jgi:hypothetical protein